MSVKIAAFIDRVGHSPGADKNVPHRCKLANAAVEIFRRRFSCSDNSSDSL
jgi:hypothetical protein